MWFELICIIMIHNEVLLCCEDMNKSQVPTKTGQVLREARTFTKILLNGSGDPTDISSSIPLKLSVHDHKSECRGSKAYPIELK